MMFIPIAIGIPFSIFNCQLSISTMSSGYSNTPLIRKLGIKPDTKLLLLQVPDAYFNWLGEDLRQQCIKGKEIADLVHLFVTNMKTLDREMLVLKKMIRLNPQLVIWVSWYKKAAKKDTDVTEDGIRDYALQNGLVDVKVCAVNEEWSGLKLVVPLRNR